MPKPIVNGHLIQRSGDYMSNSTTFTEELIKANQHWISSDGVIVYILSVDSKWVRMRILGDKFYPDTRLSIDEFLSNHTLVD